MALSSKLHSSFWSDEDLQHLDPAGKLAIVWVLTNRDMTNIGYLKVQPRQFQFDTGLDIKALEGALKGVSRTFCFEDRKGGLGVLSLNYVAHQFGASAFDPKNKVCSNLVGLARSLTEPMQEALIQRYKGLGSLLNFRADEEGGYKPLQGTSTEQHSTAQHRSSSSEGSPEDQNLSRGHKNFSENHPEKPGENVPRGTMVHANGAADPSSSRPEMDFDAASKILRFLNEKTGALYPATPPVIREIALRLKEVNQDVDGVRQMIERQVALWSGDQKMVGYLRPQTLFEAGKFSAYFGQRQLALQPMDGGDRRKTLLAKIETSPANRQSVHHSNAATEQDRTNLKKWRAELAELEGQS